MSIVGGLDVCRNQITYDWVDHATGETARGRVSPATREVFASWLATLPAGDAAFAVEACTGWRFVVEGLERAGLVAHLAEPADTATLRGRKRRAKTDRADAASAGAGRAGLAGPSRTSRRPTSWICDG